MRLPAGAFSVEFEWDGFTWMTAYWRPNAPADWKDITYIPPKNADGTPRPRCHLAVDRPTVTGRMGVNIPNPLTPTIVPQRLQPAVREATGVSKSLGGVYHALSWIGGANYGDATGAHRRGDYARWQRCRPETGKSYDAVVRFSSFKQRLDVPPATISTAKKNASAIRPARRDQQPARRNDVSDIPRGPHIRQPTRLATSSRDYFRTRTSGTSLNSGASPAAAHDRQPAPAPTDYDRWNATRPTSWAAG